MPTFEQLLSFYQSFFYFPDITGSELALGIGLALIFGIAWIACYGPPYSHLIKKHWLWIMLIASPFITLAALTFIQIPLQSLIGIILLGDASLGSLLLFSIIPTALISGLVIVGAKMIPAVVYWLDNKREISAKNGLLIGAAAGMLFGILEAQGILNLRFIQGWNLDLIQSYGLFDTMSIFWERFFVIGLHISTCALAGYGLAKGKGWQFYLLAAVLHGVLEYIFILLKASAIGLTGGEVLVSFWVIVVSAAALWVRWTRIDVKTK